MAVVIAPVKLVRMYPLIYYLNYILIILIILFNFI